MDGNLGLSEQRTTTTAAAKRVFLAPGRVNLIGEHTDYNDGFVMPAAIRFSTRVEASARADHKLTVRSETFGETREFSLKANGHRAAGHWSDYVLGVAAILVRAGFSLAGADLRVLSDIPMGAGLSSSAAIEVATASALLAVSGISLGPVEVARLCQQAENDFVGMRCGIMDQLISCCGVHGHALILDCRSLAYRPLPLPAGVQLVICNTMKRHQLAAGEYNRRRADCESGVRFLRAALPHIQALRDVTPDDLVTHGSKLPERIYRRCRHVIGENIRVNDAALALEQGDLPALGRLMAGSHASLRDDYEVSCPELDLMVEIAVAAPGVKGARMTGGGFGGCTVNLVDTDRVGEFQHSVSAAYAQATGLEPEIYVSGAAEGAHELISL